MRRVAQICSVTALVVAGTVSALPANGALGTWTKITSPKGPGQQIVQYQSTTTSETTLDVSGITSSDVTTNVNIYCFSHSNTRAVGPLNAAPVPVAGGAFNASGLTISQSLVPCVLRAVPDTDTSIAPNGLNSGFVGAYGG